MKRIFIYYIFPLLSFLTISCQDDLAIKSDNDYSESDGRSVSVMVDIPNVRTRAIDMNAGAGVYLKNIWIGVYDKTNGNRVGGTGPIGNYENAPTFTDEINLGDYLAATGNTIIDLVPIGFANNTIYDKNNPSFNTDKYLVVGVANYKDVKTIDGIDLYDVLSGATNWETFKDIAIDIKTCNANVQTPLLMGFMEKKTNFNSADYGYVKVNQFGEEVINLSDYNNTASNIFLSSKADNVINTANHVLKLRRLQSRINVKINETPIKGITILNLEYQVFNNPGSVYLAQRRTHDFGQDKNGKIEAEYSPNSADSETDGYFDDEKATAPPIVTDFSFDHFENKHWAKNTDGLSDYHDREKNDGKGTFNVLADNKDDWNNNASYFVLKMNIRDENTGKNGEIYYTIHEGFINKSDGTEANDFATRLQDFSCVRNTEYTYKITVRSIDDITVQVENSSNHPVDQTGDIWRMNHILGYSGIKLVEAGETTKIEKDAESKDITVEIINSDNYDPKDIALRLVGSYFDPYKKKDITVDLCYNFNSGDLNGFAGLWPDPSNQNTEYIVEKEVNGEKVSASDAFEEFYTGNSENAKNLNDFIDKIKVKHNGKFINVQKYIEAIQEEGVSPNINGYQVEGYKYYVGFDETVDKVRDNLRGLYIFDKQKALENGTRINKDADECSRLFQINAFEQKPFYLTAEDYEIRYATSTANSEGAPLGPELKDNNTYTNFPNGKDNSTGMLLSEQPDIAFRLLGYDGNTNDYYDIWYNFGLTEYSYYLNNNLWPKYDLNNTKSVFIGKNKLGASDIPESFLEGIQIIVNESSTYKLNDFIFGYENGSIALSDKDKIGFEVHDYAKVAYSEVVTKKREKMRALYIFDKKNKNTIPPLYKSEDHSATFQVYAVEQYPGYDEPKPLPTPTNITLGNYTVDNYMVQYIAQNVTLPVLEGYNPADYLYKIIIGSAEWIVNVTPNGDVFTFDIPMRATNGVENNQNIYLQYVSLNDEYKDSEKSVAVGRVVLNPQSWDFTSQYWQNIYNTWTGYKKANGDDIDRGFNHATYKYGYLSLVSPENTNSDRIIQGRADGIYFNNSYASIQFRVYKNCTLNITGSGTISITGGNPTSLNLNSNNPKTYIDIGDNDFMDISIERSGGAATISTMRISP